MEQNCKILMATMGLDIGGAETHIVELAKELKKRGYDVIIASNGGVYVPEVEAAGIRHYCVPMNRRKVFAIWKSYRLMKQIIEKERPDIVHAHARIPGFICGKLHKKMKFHFVTTAHWVFDTSGILKYISNWGQKTVSVSDDIKQYLMDNYGIAPENIFVTINGIDTDKFSPQNRGEKVLAEFGLDSSKPIISYVSRMDEDRALVARHLIEIAPQLSNEIPGVQLLIAGGGNVFDELNEKAKKINEQLGRTCITMTGPRTDINDIVAVGDLFVGVSRAALEAMAAAKPVIVAGNEGYVGLFSQQHLAVAQEGNFCCRGCQASSPQLLFDDIVRFFHDLSVEEKASLGNYGREVIFEYYSVARMADDCLKAYDAVLAEDSKKRVLISGYYGFGNSGDEAILQAVYANIQSVMDGNVEISVLSNEPEETRRRYGYHTTHRFHFRSVLQAIRKCDVLVSGGGSLLQDRTSTRSLLYYLSIIYLSELMGKKVMLYANGIGPVRKKNNRRLVRWLLNKADIITLRDENSAKELRNMGVINKRLYVTGDPVFTMDPPPKKYAKSVLERCGMPSDVPFVVVSVRNWAGRNDLCEKMAALCDEIFQKYHKNILFVPMQIPHDINISREVIAIMNSPACILDQQVTSEELMSVIGAADFVIAMRLHTLIFAAHMDVPFMGLVYDPKIRYYIDAFSMPNGGDVENLDLNALLKTVDDLTEHHDEYVERVKRTSMIMTEKAHHNEAYLRELLEQ